MTHTQYTWRPAQSAHSSSCASCNVPLSSASPRCSTCRCPRQAAHFGNKLSHGDNPFWQRPPIPCPVLQLLTEMLTQSDSPPPPLSFLPCSLFASLTLFKPPALTLTQNQSLCISSVVQYFIYSYFYILYFLQIVWFPLVSVSHFHSGAVVIWFYLICILLIFFASSAISHNGTNESFVM